MKRICSAGLRNTSISSQRPCRFTTASSFSCCNFHYKMLCLQLSVYRAALHIRCQLSQILNRNIIVYMNLNHVSWHGFVQSLFRFYNRHRALIPQTVYLIFFTHIKTSSFCGFHPVRHLEFCSAFLLFSTGFRFSNLSMSIPQNSP